MTTDPASGSFRDAYGIPHLRADTVEELAFAQGANAALDRAWQIEVNRWRYRGTAARHLGASWVGWDRFARQARLADTARRSLDGLDPATRAWLDAYMSGVGSALPEGRRRAPEFAAAGLVELEEDWSAVDPLGAFLVQHILFGSFPSKLWRAQVIQTLGAEALSALASEGPHTSGSNAWVVTGARTASGLPMIAGDPHRVIEAPNVYQQVRLSCPDFDVLGLAFPGVPGIPHFGHAGSVAWAITNAMADYQDLFVEDLQRADDGSVRARGPRGAEDVDRSLETIDVRGGSSVEVECLETARGPVVVGGPEQSPAYSLRTPSRVESDLGFAALLPLLRARTSADVHAALDHWVEPVNSVVTADDTGAARTRIAGLVPLRDKGNRISPVPAWEPRTQWQGYVDLPGGPVDATGVAVHANDRRPDTAGVGDDFAAPHRARRITELLGTRTGLDADAMTAIHRDCRLGTAPALKSLLGSLGDTLTPAARAVQERILAWDGHLHADSTDGAVFAIWRTAFVRRIAADPVFAALDLATAYAPLFATWTDRTARIGHALESLLATPGSLGLDLPRLAGAALQDAVGTSGTWGERHRLETVGVTADGVAAPVVPSTALSGDGDCVCSTHSRPGLSERSYQGPVARYVWDLADRAASGWVVPLGASGVPGHPHHGDQLDLWAAGLLLPVDPGWEDLTPDLGTDPGVARAFT